MESLKQARMERGYSLTDLQKATGISRVSLSKIENNHTSPRKSTRRIIEDVLDTQIFWLENDPVKEQALLSDWVECLEIFRMMILKVNGLVKKDERQKFLETAIGYLQDIQNSGESRLKSA